MDPNTIPSEPPPPYSLTSTSTSSTSRPSSSTIPSELPSQDPTHLQTPNLHKTRSGIPPSARRSMEDESRPLPSGWIRQYDRETAHQFFVDTSQEPPRSIWHHPYDDSEFLSTLSAAERERLRVAGMQYSGVPSREDVEVESSDENDEGADDHLPRFHAAQVHANTNNITNNSNSHPTTASNPNPNSNSGTTTKGREEEPLTRPQKLTRKIKDKLTNTTHQQRALARQKRAEEERILYERHQQIRAQMARAAETGQPQLLGRDREGKEVWIEPPVGYGGYRGGRGYGYNPYTQGLYASPDARYVRPRGPYGRPYGGGYGGGYGMPIGLGLGGGLLLGGLLC